MQGRHGAPDYFGCYYIPHFFIFKTYFLYIYHVILTSIVHFDILITSLYCIFGNNLYW